MSKRKLLVPIVVMAVLIAVVLIVARSRNGLPRAWVASGTVEATEAQLGFPVPGRIEQIHVREGDTVVTGEVLARLDCAEAEAKRAQASAQVGVARAVLEELERGSRSEELAQARAAKQTAQDRLDDARRDWERTRQLYEGGAVSREAFDKAQTMLNVAQGQFTQAAEQLRLVETGPRTERIAAQRAQVLQAEAGLKAVEVTLQNMTIRAPFAGVVTVRHREPGEIVPAGAPVLTVLNRSERWVRIFAPEDRIGALHIGQPAAISTDTYPQRRYRGEVMTIASEAEFTPKTVQTSEERVRLVYAVKVRIIGDTAYELKPGMPADIRLGF